MVTSTLLTILVSTAGLSFAQGSAPTEAVRPLWGDLHLHTQWSCDTGLFGMVVTPNISLRFARGEEINGRARSTSLCYLRW